MSNRRRKRNDTARGVRSKTEDLLVAETRKLQEAVDAVQRRHGSEMAHGFLWGVRGSSDDLAILPVDPGLACPPLYHEKLEMGFDVKTVVFNCVLFAIAAQSDETPTAVAEEVRHFGVVYADGRCLQFVSVT